MRKKTVVLGFGVSGRAAVSFLLKRGIEVWVSDRNIESLLIDPEVLALQKQGVCFFGETISLDEVLQIVVSPGILPTHPLLEEAKKQKIEIIGEIELAFRHIQNRSVGITGTNGKTTTALLTTHLLNQAGKKARALGNVGVALSSYLLQPDPEEILVIELSSFQLQTVQSSILDAAVLLNITPNHLDRHPTMEEYVCAKVSIRDRLKKGGVFFVSNQVAQTYGVAGELLDLEIPPSSLGRENVQAAFRIAHHFGVPYEDLAQSLFSFQKPPHRTEWVADIGRVSYYNDSKSSNIHSVIHAVGQLRGPLVLIAGGIDKGASYVPWIDAFQGKVRQIIAYGAAREKMERELSAHFPLKKRALFQDAVLEAHQDARPNEIVLLSPGCSSYDQFKNFEHRGDVFRQIVNELRKEWIEKKQS